jgi:hypothetical protein
MQVRDMGEGADILMVKPTMPYLDVLADMAQLAPDHPLACYQVSGEFAMIHAGARTGVYDLRTMAFESVNGALRAGACSYNRGLRARADECGQARRSCSRILRPTFSSGCRRRHSSQKHVYVVYASICAEDKQKTSSNALLHLLRMRS